MSDCYSPKSELTASEQAALWVREAALPITAGMQIQTQINQASRNLRLSPSETKRIWYRETSLSADKFLVLKEKYKNFVTSKTGDAYGNLSGELALLKTTYNQLERQKSEKNILSDDIKNLHKAIDSLSKTLKSLPKGD